MDLIIDNRLHKEIRCNLFFDDDLVEIYTPSKNFYRIFNEDRKFFIKNVYYKHVGVDGFTKYGCLFGSVLNGTYTDRVILKFDRLDEADKYIAAFRKAKLSLLR